MALPEHVIKEKYPLPAYNFRLAVLLQEVNKPLLADESDLTTFISCTEVSGLDQEIEWVRYRDGFSFLKGDQFLLGLKETVHLRLFGGIVKNRTYFSDWMSLVYPNKKLGLKNTSIDRNILIDLCDEKGLPVIRWTVVRAFPIRLSGPSLDASTSEVSFEQLDLVADQLQVNYNP
jgi:phage tail-like protein